MSKILVSKIKKGCDNVDKKQLKSNLNLAKARRAQVANGLTLTPENRTKLLEQYDLEIESIENQLNISK